MKTVCIEMDDDGTIMVGLEPETADASGAAPQEGTQPEEDQEKSWMSPAKSLDDALSTAKDLLTSDQAAQANDQASNDAFEGGFKGVSGAQGLM
jgi:hypothetical protein